MAAMDTASETFAGQLADAIGNGAATVRVGLVGRGIQLSRSPAMHEAEAARLGMRLTYRLLDTDSMDPPPPDFATVLRAAEIAGYAGVNVTYPYKRDAHAAVDELSENAALIGAVNTVVFRDGRRFGHNTDCFGFGESFRRGMAGVAIAEVLQLGAGGAGAAVAQALLDAGVGRLTIRDTDADAAGLLAERLAARYGADRVAVADNLAAAAARSDGIVNASPVGMASMPGTPMPAELLASRHWVADVIYFPAETELLRAARALGCRTLPGAGMAVYQAARAFELFTGQTPDPERMKAAFDAFDHQDIARSGPS